MTQPGTPIEPHAGAVPPPPVPWVPGPPRPGWQVPYPPPRGPRAPLGVVIGLALLPFVLLGLFAGFRLATSDGVGEALAPTAVEAPPPPAAPVTPPDDAGVPSDPGSVWAARDGVHGVRFEDVDTVLAVVDDAAGTDCRAQPLVTRLPTGCDAWSSGRLLSEQGTVQVDVVLLHMPTRERAAEVARADDEGGVVADLGGTGTVVRSRVVQVGGSTNVLYLTARAVPGTTDDDLEAEAVEAARATALIATDAVLAGSFPPAP